MVETKSAAFKFVRFQIPVFSYNESGKKESILKLDFVPNGKYCQEDGIFKLDLEFSGTEDDEEKKLIIYARCVAFFEFEKDLPFSEIPSYFYKNAIAIVFPYIRSFISTMTLQANSGLIMLGLMNLSSLEVPLLKNTISE
jgi:preprotein translocase subunit SecB